MTIARLGSSDFSYVDQGSGEVLVLLHGFPLDHTMWKHQIAELTGYRMIVPDLRGHGESSVTDGTVTMAEMARDVAALLDHLDVNYPVNFGGLSMGGYVAWEFWSQFPARLKKLLLFDTRAVADTEQVARGRQMMAAQVVTAGASMAAHSMLPKLVSPTTQEKQPELVEDLQRIILAADPRAIAATQRGMANRQDMVNRLTDVTLPTLLVCGEHDVISTPTEMQGIADAMPQAHFVEIANAGHLAPLEQPTAVNQAMLEFLAN